MEINYEFLKRVWNILTDNQREQAIKMIEVQDDYKANPGLSYTELMQRHNVSYSTTYKYLNYGHLDYRTNKITYEFV